MPTTEKRSAEIQGLDSVTPLAGFKVGRRPLRPTEMACIVQQAITLIRDCYVHLPLKQAAHGIDPERALGRLLESVFRWPGPSERKFHDTMIEIFDSLRDLHTIYVLPRPYRQQIAFLPWQIEEYYEGDDEDRVFVVSRVCADLEPDLRPGTIVTHWNGVPINRAVSLMAARRRGSNTQAAWARAIDALTFRWMGTTGRPDEDVVTLTCRVNRKRRDFVSPWYVTTRTEDGPTGDAASGRGLSLGLDEESDWIRRVKQCLFPDVIDPGDPPCAESFRGVLRARRIGNQEDGFGYLRIFSFSVDDPVGFVDEVARLVQQLPKRGLIVDVRGNGGGDIVAAERVLQLFTEKVIEPAPLRFRNTGVMARVADHHAFAPGLGDAIRHQSYTGVPFSSPTPLADASVYNDIDWTYEGNVVLIIDAMSYSATDIFAAGFEDHEIGSIIGTDSVTGAGGANVWGYETLRAFLQDGREPQLSPLPFEASFTVAVRQASRVGLQRGNPLEHLGVQAWSCSATRDDVLLENKDLIGAAVEELTSMEADGAVDIEQQAAALDLDYLRRVASEQRPVQRRRVLETLAGGLAEFDDRLIQAVAATHGEAAAVFSSRQPRDTARIVGALTATLGRGKLIDDDLPSLDGALRWLRDVAAASANAGRWALLDDAAGALFDASARYRRLGERYETRVWLSRLADEPALRIARLLNERPRAVRWYRSEGWKPPAAMAPDLVEVLGSPPPRGATRASRTRE